MKRKKKKKQNQEKKGKENYSVYIFDTSAHRLRRLYWYPVVLFGFRERWDTTTATGLPSNPLTTTKHKKAKKTREPDGWEPPGSLLIQFMDKILPQFGWMTDDMLRYTVTNHLPKFVHPQSPDPQTPANVHGTGLALILWSGSP